MAMKPKPIRFEEETLERLDKLARIEERDASYLVRKAVDELLEAHEWQVQQSLEVIEKIKSGEMETLSHEEVKARFKAKRRAS